MIPFLNIYIYILEGCGVCNVVHMHYAGLFSPARAVEKLGLAGMHPKVGFLLHAWMVWVLLCFLKGYSLSTTFVTRRCKLAGRQCTR